MFKLAYIMPLLKKSDLNSADLKSYWPIANLSLLLKLLERLVAGQVLDYVNSNEAATWSAVSLLSQPLPRDSGN